MAVKSTKPDPRVEFKVPSGIHEQALKVAPKSVSSTIKESAERWREAHPPTEQQKAVEALQPFISKEARGDDEVVVLDVTAAVRSGSKQSDLQAVGVSGNQIQKAYAQVESEDYDFVPEIKTVKVDPVVVPTPTPQPAEKPKTKRMLEEEKRARKQVALASLTETVGGWAPGVGLTVGAVTQNELAQSEAIKVVNDAEMAGEISQHQAKMVIEDIKKSVANTKQWAIESRAITTEILLSQIPIYGTYRNWGHSPGWLNGVGVAADIATVIPILGQISGGVRAGAKVPTILRGVAVAEVTGPINAIKNPIRAAKAFVDPLEIVIPKKIPLAAVEVKTNTIRIPGTTVHAPSPFTIAIPKDLLTDIGLGAKAKKGAVYLEDIPDLAARQRIASLMEARDLVTKAAVKGDDAKAIFNVGEGLAEVKIKAPALQKTTGEAAVHSTDDLRGFILDDVVAAGSEGGLFVAEGAKSRFVKGAATGKKTLEEKLLAAEEGAYDPAPIQKIIDAVKTGQLPDKPMPGTLLIRDEKVLDTLTGSNKLWQGNAEVELVIPDGTVIPKVSQLIHTRLADGTRAHIAVVGKPFTPAELVKLKIVGAKETVTGMFGRVGKVSKVDSKAATKASTSMTTAVTEGRKAESLTIAANKAADAGEATKAAQLTREAGDAADNARRAADIANEYAGMLFAARVRPAAVYTGDQDISAGFRAVDEGSKYLETGRGPVVRDRPSDSEYRQSRQELAPLTTRGQIDVTSAVRIGIPNDVLLRGGVPAAAIRAAIDGLRTNPRTQDPVVVRPDRPNDIELPTRPAQEDLNRERERIADDLKNTPVPIPRDVFKPRMEPPETAPRRRPPDKPDDVIPPRRPPDKPDDGIPPPRQPDKPDDGIPPPRQPDKPDDGIPPPRPPNGNGDGRVRPPPDGNGGGRVRPPRRRDNGIPRPPDRPPTPVKYKLPGGRSLKRGEFPVEVTWPQGVVQITRNLLTGETTYKSRTPDETTPQEGFTVSRIGPTRPRLQVLDMGQTDALVSKDYISFRGSRTAAPGRQFRRSKGRL
jgi:hypothetical protein